MRERRCTEMLCGILLNCPELRGCIFRWLATVADQPTDVLDDLEWRVETERPIGAKRDDLRIEGFAPESDGDGPRRVVLWTVEVKVQAYFHASTDQTGGPPAGNSDETDDDETPMVNQLVNYDAWLEGQVADHKAGFVLAIPDHAGDLPEGLTQKWACTTWTRLGNTVRQALEGNALPESEAEWAKHLLGFIRTYLWSASEMADIQLTLDHVAFLRANWFLGAETEHIVDDLVASLEPVLAESGLGLAKLQHQKNLYQSMKRSVYFGLIPPKAAARSGWGRASRMGGSGSGLRPLHAIPRKSELVERLREDASEHLTSPSSTGA